ncbi:acyl-CoA dehydrogenase family protein [Leucobacter denitrificans]|uniref:Acyl-CoA dehydrogenase family protein n=1 Tax=Leucobacter denitrificans TaxID=683042 RepID=A0A7G9S2R5_9MICO|nr:acyl-CoA dehydrogenase family protein [Leucobacter denitrificans]QNN62140.1 acyl-CoA dehydrogenase family protein [Leucobacter denitrificans]
MIDLRKLTDDQRALVETVRHFSETALVPYANERDQQKIFPIDVLAQAGELGLGAIYTSEEHCGSGLTRADTAIIFEELGRGDPALAAYISIHNMVVWMIDTFGNDAQRAKWIPRLASMHELSSYCLTEPGAGSDAAALTTTARRDGDEYVINGSKQFISGAGTSRVYLVMARTGGEGAHGVSAILVPAESDGLNFGVPEKKMGWNTQPTRAVMFDDVRVPVENRLGDEGQGFSIAMRGLNGGRLNIAACALGGAQWALEQSIHHLKEREAFGAPLATKQALVFKLADMETELQAARLLLSRAAEALDTGHPEVATVCAMAKRFVTDAAFNAANSALQLHGGYGYLSQFGIERVVRDLRVHQILEGTNEIMNVIIGRTLLEE